MFPSTLALGLLFAASISAVVIPRAPQRNYDPNHPEWPDRYKRWAWGPGNETLSADFVQQHDDFWLKLDLEFPITMFGKTSKVAWASVNGILTIDEPSKNGPSVPERPLPVDPADCSATSGGCLPDTAILPLWRDMGLRAGLRKDELTILYAFTYHPGLETPHYHIQWRFCDKNVSWEFDPGLFSPCGKAYRMFTMTFSQARPGWYNVLYQLNNAITSIEGVIGMQSYSEGKTLKVPTTDIVVPGRDGAWQIDFDTNAMNYTISKFSYV
ncbi:hypothetical protein ABW21_db0206191 [Orbilia brochopaga]|nr:hypothetical protein ABW21_db0206191 [Drechslerella brochopaga]